MISAENQYPAFVKTPIKTIVSYIPLLINPRFCSPGKPTKILREDCANLPSFQGLPQAPLFIIINDILLVWVCWKQTFFILSNRTRHEFIASSASTHARQKPPAAGLFCSGRSIFYCLFLFQDIVQDSRISFYKKAALNCS